MHTIFQIFVVGFVVLVGAVIINFLAGLAGLMTWYQFLLEFKEKGFNQGIFSLIFLFIIYPLLLGIISYYTTLAITSGIKS